MEEMNNTKKLIEVILKPNFTDNFYQVQLPLIECLQAIASLASKEIAEQEARERGEQK